MSIKTTRQLVNRNDKYRRGLSDVEKRFLSGLSIRSQISFLASARNISIIDADKILMKEKYSQHLI